MTLVHLVNFKNFIWADQEYEILSTTVYRKKNPQIFPQKKYMKKKGACR